MPRSDSIKQKTTPIINKQSRRPRIETIGRVAIPKAKKQSHICLAISSTEAESFSDSGSIRRRTKVKTALDFDLSYRPRSDPID
ncbi:hypothetical protein M0802_013778 [Mischocyttarus mexicanus]|nr:hypothetical protein M0802_013778 [Mischocyttarus mexicanus]